jgi:hypothetical protein
MAHAEEDDALPGQDSFIDVVCNMVGILIVLVMIVGVRASSADTPPVIAAKATVASATAKRRQGTDAKTLAELNETANRAAEAEREINTAVQQVADMAVQSALIDARRQELSILQAAIEQQIAERRDKLDGVGKRQFDAQREIAANEIKLHQLTQEQLTLVSQSSAVEEIECVPTPLAKEVTGEEIHVRLRRGQLAVVPAEALMEEVKLRGADYLRNGLRDRNQAEDVFGPIDGFRMRMSAQRIEAEVIPGQSPLTAPERSTVVLQGVFLPTADNIGQPVEQALLPDSSFMRALRSKRSTAPAVTVWVYPDSYTELRSLKKAMWEAGVPMAVRPLADGQPIIFSTAGTRSAAQ